MEGPDNPPPPEPPDRIAATDAVVVVAPAEPPEITPAVARVLLRILLLSRDNQS